MTTQRPLPKSALHSINKWRKEPLFQPENNPQTLLPSGFSQIDIQIYPTIVVRALRGGLSDDFKHN
jgi:hypothetical protein